MIFLENRQSRVTIVIILRDELQPDKIAVGELFLKVPGMKRLPLQHRSGCFLLRDVAKGKYTITFGGERYQEDNIVIDTRTVNLARPLVELVLKPKAQYEFPSGMTVLKGKIIDAAEGRPILGVAMTITNRTERAISDDRGDYFIIFSGVASDMSITVRARTSGYRTATVQVELVKGSTRFLPLRLTKS